MKRFVVLLLVCVLVLSLVVTGCSSSSKDNSVKEIKKAKELIVGLDDAFPPMGFRDENDEVVGFDVDLAKEVAKRMGVEAVFQPIDWDSKVMELNNKNIDMIWNGLSITEERQKEILFTKPYMEDKQLIVTLADSEISTKAELAGKKVGCQLESTSYNAMQSDKEIFNSFGDVVQYPTNNDVFMDLSSGRIDAMVVDEVVGRYYMAKKPSEYKILDENFGLEEFGVGLRLTDESLKLELEKALSEMIKDGTAQEISNKWFGDNVVKQ